MAVKSLALQLAGPFRRAGVWNDIELEFNRQVNLMIGPNNVGKSTILRTLALIVGGDAVRQHLPGHFKKTLYEWPQGKYPRFTMRWSNFHGEPRTMDGRQSGLFGAGSLFIQIGESGDVEEVEYYGEGKLKIDTLVRELGYVGYYNPEMSGIDSTHKELSDSGEAVEDSAVLDIFREFALAMPGRAFEESDLLDETGTDEWRLGLEKFRTPDGLVVFPELSHGTRSVLDWVRQFEGEMKRFYDGSANWKEMPGVFIIDEIDAHLHPSWQRRIIPTLTRHFPNVQIFASTHSPMMVAGLKAGQVHLLKRNETTGAVVWSRNEQDIIGWTADEIYRTFMGIDDPTDYDTAQHAEDLRALREKASLTPAEEERMQELRRLVNEDLLARGALNAQQERFDAMMQEYRRSRASDLSQDVV